MRPRLLKIVEAEIRQREIIRIKIAAGLGSVMGLSFTLMTVNDADFITKNTTIPGYIIGGVVVGAGMGAVTGLLCTTLGLGVETVNQAFKLAGVYNHKKT